MKLIFDIAKKHYANGYCDNHEGFISDVNKKLCANYIHLVTSDWSAIFHDNFTYIEVRFTEITFKLKHVEYYDDMIMVIYDSVSDIDTLFKNDNFLFTELNFLKEVGKRYYHELEEHEKEILRMNLSLS
jgi:hypothetical protein